MKIRHGFVSNSSSSSFVVAFPKKPETVEEMRELLFKDVQSFPAPYDDHNYPATQIAEIVLRDMGEPLTDEQAIEELVAGYWGGNYNQNRMLSGLEDRKGEWNREEWGKMYAIFDELQTNDAKAVICRMHERYPGWQLFKFSYSDNDGALPAAMEHGGLFELLPHEQVSHH